MFYNIIFTNFYNFFLFVTLFTNENISIIDVGAEAPLSCCLTNEFIMSMKNFIKKIVRAYFDTCAQVYEN